MWPGIVSPIALNFSWGRSPIYLRPRFLPGQYPSCGTSIVAGTSRSSHPPQASLLKQPAQTPRRADSRPTQYAVQNRIRAEVPPLNPTSFDHLHALFVPDLQKAIYDADL